MEPGLSPLGLQRLARSRPLRLENPAGRHLSVVGGEVWITQQGDPRDHLVARGETFRFDRDGLALVVPVGAPAQVWLEDGLMPPAGRRRLAAIARAALERLAGAPARALRRHRTQGELERLSDHMLRDLGLRRDQIPCVAAGCAERA